MRMEQGVGTGLGHGGITGVLQTQFSSFFFFFFVFNPEHFNLISRNFSSDRQVGQS